MIEAVGLGKTFDTFTAVHSLDLHVATGELVVLLGPNGAGKTTTVRMLGAILRPTHGYARVNKYDVVTEAQQVRQAIGILTEQPGLYLRMSGLEYLTFFGRLYGLADGETHRRSLALFDRFAMPGAAQRRLGEFSKGMRQKVGLIRAMLHDPPLLLLDEPTSAMDPHSAKLVRDAIRELQTDRRTIVLCTHNLAEAEMLADRIVIIKAGTIVAQGTARELKQQLLGQPRLVLTLDQPLNGELPSLSGLVTVEWVRDRVICYRTAVPEQTNPQLVRHLTSLGLGIVSLVEIERSLEDVYLQVVGSMAEGATHDNLV